MANLVFKSKENSFDIGRFKRLHPEMPEVLFESSHCLITSCAREHTPQLDEAPGGILVSFGLPIYKKKTSESWSHDDIKSAFAQPEQLDSSFVLSWIRSEGKDVELISDRFGSIPIFYFETAQVNFFSTEFRNAVAAYKVLGEPKLSESAIFEFLWFRRLFGQKTYIDQIKIIPSGSKLKSVEGKLQNRIYWKPIFSQESLSRAEWVDRLTASADAAGSLSLKPTGKHGLMLSGGLDSRCLLSLGGDRYQTFCNAPVFNTEARVAERLAQVVGSTHHFIKRPTDYVDQTFEESMFHSHGMTQFYECQFLGYINFLSEKVNHIHLGLFWDIFFCGHYMPKTLTSILGRPLLHFRLEKVNFDHLADAYLNKVSFRQKTSNLAEFIDDSFFRSGYRHLLNSIQGMMDEGKKLGFEREALWEYIHLINVGRHYSMLMAKSLRPHMNVMLPSLTNENYDVALSLPTEEKLNWAVYQGMLTRLSPALMREMNANTQMMANKPLQSQSVRKIVRGAKNFVKSGALNVSVGFEERSWPRVRDEFFTNPYLRSRVEEMIHEGRLMNLGFFEKAAVGKAYDDTIKGCEDHAILINQLLTLEYGFLQSL